MKIDVPKIKFLLFSILLVAIISWLTLKLSDLPETFLQALLGVIVFYFSFRALYWPINTVDNIKGLEDIFKIKSLEPLSYLMTLGLGVAAITNLVIYLFKIFITGINIGH